MENTSSCVATLSLPVKSGRRLPQTAWTGSRSVSWMPMSRLKPPGCKNVVMRLTTFRTMWPSRLGCGAMCLITGIGPR